MTKVKTKNIYIIMYFIHLLLNILFVTLSSGYLLSQVHYLNVEKLFFNRKKIWKLFEIKIRLWQKTKIILLLHNLKWYTTLFKKNYPYPWKLLAKLLYFNILLIYFCSDIYILFLSLIVSVLTTAAKHWLRGWDLVSHLKGSAIVVKI